MIVAEEGRTTDLSQKLLPLLLIFQANIHLDFGRIVEGDLKFNPSLNIYPNNFDFSIKKNDCTRYFLEICAEGFKNKKFQVFEICWNGKWTDNLDEMETNLIIREIKEEKF